MQLHRKKECPQRNFSGHKESSNIADVILVNFKKDFIAIRLECYYTEPSEVFIFEAFSSMERIKPSQA